MKWTSEVECNFDTKKYKIYLGTSMSNRRIFGHLVAQYGGIFRHYAAWNHLISKCCKWSKRAMKKDIISKNVISSRNTYVCRSFQYFVFTILTFPKVSFLSLHPGMKYAVLLYIYTYQANDISKKCFRKVLAWFSGEKWTRSVDWKISP